MDAKHIAVVAVGILAGLYAWRNFIRQNVGTLAGSKSNL